MYHSVVGKRLVSCVNKRDGTTYTVRQFFEQEYVPLFFGKPRMLQHVTNSPFAQAFTTGKKTHTPELLLECVSGVHQKVESLSPDASFFLGGPAKGNIESTSGQVTSMKLPFLSDDIYASWMGAALGLTVQGGLNILMDSDEVLLATYDGWKRYRKLLDQTPHLKAHQVNTWNGQWIAHSFRSDEMKLDEDAFVPNTNKDGTALETIGWVQLLFSLTALPKGDTGTKLTGYVYSLGKSNRTVGFVQFDLPDASNLSALYRRLFQTPSGMPPSCFEDLYDTELGFQRACENTLIGVRALRPKDIFKSNSEIPTPPKETEYERQVAFDTYQTWIIAMLNNKELLTRADDLAVALDDFRMREPRMKTANEGMVEELISKKSRKEVISALADILDKDQSLQSLFEGIVADLMTISPDNIPLFLTLVKFRYSVAKAKKRTTAK